MLQKIGGERKGKKTKKTQKKDKNTKMRKNNDSQGDKNANKKRGKRTT